MNRPRIVTVLDYYRPAKKGGGPAASVEDLVGHLGKEFAFDILSSDRDLSEREPLRVEHGVWHSVGEARVRYLAPRERTLAGWTRVLRSLSGDVLYLNSCFARSSIKILLLRRAGLAPAWRMVLAPRGELHPATLAIHAGRKAAWLRVSRAMGLYSGATWHAATPEEAGHIRRAMGGPRAAAVRDIRVARHAPMRIWDEGPSVPGADVRCKKIKRVVFVSRICRKKHLEFAIRAVAESAAELEFDIYGPIEDANYWAKCEAMLARLPSSVSAAYRGFLTPEQVVPTLSGYHLFLLPTRGESFGRLIVEAMVAGCPVLLSDQTPWTEAVRGGAGWAEALSEPGAFASRIRELVSMDDAEFRTLSAGARALGRMIAAGEGSIDASRRLFA